MKHLTLHSSFLTLPIRLLTLFLLTAITATAQEQRTVERLSIDTRGDYERTYSDTHAIDDQSGFTGKNLNVIISGHLSDRFSYFCRQRLNKAALDAGFFNATDRLYLDYQATDRLTLRGGKQTIAIGGFEYDRSSIDLYTYSEYLYNVSCYAWGASAIYDPTPHDQLLLQVCESMFDILYDHPDTYSWNLLWYGHHGRWSTTWSANMTEWQKNHYISYLCLGNKLQITDHIDLEVDFMNRAATHQTFLLSDCSIIGQLNVRPSDRLNVYAKATYDVNNTHTAADLLVHPGTEITGMGLGLEYFPLGDERVRLHANCTYVSGTNSNPAGTLQDRHTIVDLGATWRVNIIK